MESRHEAGAGRTANARPAPLRQIPSERIELLARIEPPVYEASAADPAKDSPEFRAAVEHYQKRDYAAAIPGLRAGTQAQSPSVAARFYLAICLLLTDDRPAGAAQLQAVIAAGDTPYLETSRFYLAKALLGGRNITGAERQLHKVVEMHGNLEKQAQVLLAQIMPTP
jgi:TolA-binding protein